MTEREAKRAVKILTKSGAKCLANETINGWTVYARWPDEKGRSFNSIAEVKEYAGL